MSWPPAPGAPLLDSVAQAWRESVFTPGRFFGQLGRDQEMAPSVWYYVALGMVVAGVGLFWRMVLPLDLYPAALMMEGLEPTNPLLDFLFTPLELLFSLLVTAGVVHLLLLVFGGAANGFATTVRVFCFAYGAQLFAVVPVAGSIVGGIWMVVIAIIGLREAHGTTGVRAAAAVLLPLLMFMLLAMVSVVLLGLSGLVA